MSAIHPDFQIVCLATYLLVRLEHPFVSAFRFVFLAGYSSHSHNPLHLSPPNSFSLFLSRHYCGLTFFSFCILSGADLVRGFPSSASTVLHTYNFYFPYSTGFGNFYCSPAYARHLVSLVSVISCRA